MRHEPNLRLERYRIDGPGGSNNGRFIIPRPAGDLGVICSNGAGWDHVSVSHATRCPTWLEMERVREIFFRDDECVMQLSVPRSDHVNTHPHCLHLWRPQSAGEIAAARRSWGDEWTFGDVEPAGVIPRPPSEFV